MQSKRISTKVSCLFLADLIGAHSLAEMAHRRAFVDFVEGLLNLDPIQRWSPQQAAKHPFITGEKFTGPFQVSCPEVEVPVIADRDTAPFHPFESTKQQPAHTSRHVQRKPDYSDQKVRWTRPESIVKPDPTDLLRRRRVQSSTRSSPSVYCPSRRGQCCTVTTIWNDIRRSTNTPDFAIRFRKSSLLTHARFFAAKPMADSPKSKFKHIWPTDPIPRHAHVQFTFFLTSQRTHRGYADQSPSKLVLPFVPESSQHHQPDGRHPSRSRSTCSLWPPRSVW